MRFETKDIEEEWNKKYELAKAYYEHYRNLESTNYEFKTKNGYDSDEKGTSIRNVGYLAQRTSVSKDKTNSKIA